MFLFIFIFLLLILTFFFFSFKKEKLIIVSLTTSPRRIKLMKEVIESILNQTHPPDIIRINIPTKFQRTKQTFDEIPEYLLNHPKICIFEYEEDFGPIMKILPTLLDRNDEYKSYKDVTIIYTDDDVKMLPNTIEIFLKYIAKNPDDIYCFSGFDIKTWNRSSQETYVDLVEGYMGVCLSSKVINKLLENKSLLLKYYNQIIKKNEYCFTSDDLLLSNFYNIKKIKKLKIHDKKANFDLWWSSGCELSYGRDGDGIMHLGTDQHFTRYQKAIEFLNANDFNFLPTLSSV